jgi:tRNA dimethylallyltransferase
VGWTELHQRLEKVDPDSAARIHPNDPQRIMRALEVFELTGLSLTECFERQHVGESAFDVMKMALIPDDRTRLHERIEARFDTMLEMGFVDEVKLLKDRADLDPGKPSMRAVGYRQIWEYLEGKTTLSQARDKAVIATRQLAKRQLTWLRSEQDMRGFDPLVAETAKRVREQIALEVSKYL